MQTRVNNITTIMEKNFPLFLAESWDNCGLQLGSYNDTVENIIVALDLDKEVLEEAIRLKADMIVTHHPFFFKAIKTINYEKYPGNLIKKIIINNISVYAAHTNLDSAKKGLNQLLAERIGLKNIKILDKYKEEVLYKLVVYVPTGYENALREAINSAGAGYTGKYSNVSFRTKGTGTFKPEEGANPFSGTPGKLSEEDEYRLETVVPHAKLAAVIKKVQEVHPYEEVAYDIFRLENEGGTFSMGRIGTLDVAMKLEDFAKHIKETLGLPSLRICGDMESIVKKVAVVSGAGAGFITKASSKGCDVLLTGDLKYHEAKDAQALGINVIDAGHQGTEEIVVDYLVKFLDKECRAQGLQCRIIPVYSAPCIVDV